MDVVDLLEVVEGLPEVVEGLPHIGVEAAVDHPHTGVEEATLAMIMNLKGHGTVVVLLLMIDIKGKFFFFRFDRVEIY